MKKIILLADDDKDDMQLFCEALEAIEPSVICYCATNGIEVLDILSKKESPHVIFLDINMPRMNGWQCLKAIKDTESYREIPVFMYSTSAYQREVDIALNLGALCFFTKPHSFTQLKSALKVIIENIHTDLPNALRQVGNMKCGNGVASEKTEED